jgi:large subunit ribosomal protein L24
LRAGERTRIGQRETDIVKYRIKKGDLVCVISGEDRGMRGRVLAVLRGKGRAIVEKVNMVTKHKRMRKAQTPGGLISQEAPIALSKLMLVDQKTGQPTRVRYEARPDGTRARVAKKTGNVI